MCPEQIAAALSLSFPKSWAAPCRLPALRPGCRGACHFSAPSDALGVGQGCPGKGFLFRGSVASDSLRPRGLQHARLPRPWDSPGKNTGVGRHFLLPCMKVKSLSRVQPLATHGLQPTRLLCPWDFPGKSTGVGCHCLLHLLPYLWSVYFVHLPCSQKLFREYSLQIKMWF